MDSHLNQSDENIDPLYAARIRPGIAVVVDELEETITIFDGRPSLAEEDRYEPCVLSIHAAEEFAHEVLDLAEEDPDMPHDVAERIVATEHVRHQWV